MMDAIMDSASARLDPWLEKKRRLRILAIVVPSLLNRLLLPVLGWRRIPFIVSMLLAAPSYRRTFARPGDDAGLKEVKRTFLLVGVLYHRLLDRFGEAVAFRITHAFVFELANAVQRQAYFPPPGKPRDWDWFHREHEAQIREGFIRNNENDGIVHSANRVSLHITRCRFYETFRDMGNAGLTDAFCRSDETVFNNYSPEMRFHRGTELPNTIARGAKQCTFIYDRLPVKDAAPTDASRQPRDHARVRTDTG
jgi:hypothetical protein